MRSVGEGLPVKVLSVSPLLSDLALFHTHLVFQNSLCFPRLSDGPLGKEVTVAWKGPLTGACGSVVGPSFASGVVLTEVEHVKSGSLEHLSSDTAESTAPAVYL